VLPTRSRAETRCDADFADIGFYIRKESGGVSSYPCLRGFLALDRLFSFLRLLLTTYRLFALSPTFPFLPPTIHRFLFALSLLSQRWSFRQFRAGTSIISLRCGGRVVRVQRVWLSEAMGGRTDSSVGGRKGIKSLSTFAVVMLVHLTGTSCHPTPTPTPTRSEPNNRYYKN
jgi:hypothetical protein